MSNAMIPDVILIGYMQHVFNVQINFLRKLNSIDYLRELHAGSYGNCPGHIFRDKVMRLIGESQGICDNIWQSMVGLIPQQDLRKEVKEELSHRYFNEVLKLREQIEELIRYRY